MMQTHLLLEEIKLLQQRRQQQQQLGLLQQQLLTNTHNYPLSSAFLMNGLSRLGGSGGAAAGLASSQTPATGNDGAEALLLRELQHQLLSGGGSGAGSNVLFNSILSGSPAPPDVSSLLDRAISGASAASGLSFSSTVTAAPAGSTGTMSNDELLRMVASAGLFNNSSASSVASLLLGQQAQLHALNATGAGSLPSLLGSLVGSAADGSGNRKRAGETESMDGGAAVRALDRQLQAVKRQRFDATDQMSNVGNNMQLLNRWDQASDAVHVLAVAAAEMERKPAAALNLTNLSPEGNSFPLPPEMDSKDGTSKKQEMPPLTSFRNAWDSIKTKEMQKEIFLRKLHQGKVSLS